MSILVPRIPMNVVKRVGIRYGQLGLLMSNALPRGVAVIAASCCTHVENGTMQLITLATTTNRPPMHRHTALFSLHALRASVIPHQQQKRPRCLGRSVNGGKIAIESCCCANISGTWITIHLRVVG